MTLRVLVGALLAAMVATVVVAAPSQAAPAVADLQCTVHSAVNRDLDIDMQVSGVGDGETAVAYVRAAGMGGTTDGYHFVGSSWHLTLKDFITETYARDRITVQVNVDGAWTECQAEWSAYLVGAPQPGKLAAAGATQTVIASVQHAPHEWVATAQLQYWGGTSWKTLATGSLASPGVATFTAKVSRWQLTRAVIRYGPADWLGDVIAAGPSGLLDAKVASPTIVSKPSWVLEGQAATVLVHYGSHATAGAATLQKKTSAGWKAVKVVALSHGVATVNWKPTSTLTYRVAIKPTGTSTSYTKTFKVTYKPRLTLAAPTTVKKNTNAKFTLTHNLAIPFYAYLQRWNGKKWVNVKKFVPSDTATKVVAKVTKTSKWRISTGTYVSKTVTIKTT